MFATCDRCQPDPGRRDLARQADRETSVNELNEIVVEEYRRARGAPRSAAGELTDAPRDGSVGARRCTIGVDFGTESGRVLVLDLTGGAELAVEVVPYRHGVIDRSLPGGGEPLSDDWALQHPV